ncbi:hypothetical protein E4J66_10655 [Actinomyces viscosus]|nr:hypothetical protein E4J66_10655 [Actinomyces viscosus]
MEIIGVIAGAAGGIMPDGCDDLPRIGPRCSGLPQGVGISIASPTRSLARHHKRAIRLLTQPTT